MTTANAGHVRLVGTAGQSQRNYRSRRACLCDGGRVTNAYARTCAACGDEKPLGQFRGAATHCKACVSAEGRRKRRNPAARRAARDARYRRLYGITLADYERLRRKQRNRCAICERPPYPVGSRLVPDHNHATGEVRGLLCQPCNSGLGLMGEKPERLVAAAKYLLDRGSYGDLHP